MTQFFFEAAEYEGLVADLAARSVHKPVLPGILPVTSLSTMGRLGAMGAAAPDWMQDRLRAADERGGADAVRKEGIELATELCAGLLAPACRGCTSTPSTLERDPRDLRLARAIGPGDRVDPPRRNAGHPQANARTAQHHT